MDWSGTSTWVWLQCSVMHNEDLDDAPDADQDCMAHRHEPSVPRRASDGLENIWSRDQREKQIPDDAGAEQKKRPTRQPGLPERRPGEHEASANHEPPMERVKTAK